MASIEFSKYKRVYTSICIGDKNRTFALYNASDDETDKFMKEIKKIVGEDFDVLFDYDPYICAIYISYKKYPNRIPKKFIEEYLDKLIKIFPGFDLGFPNQQLYLMFEIIQNIS